MFEEELLKYLSTETDVQLMISTFIVLPIVFSLIAFSIDRIVRLFVKGNVL